MAHKFGHWTERTSLWQRCTPRVWGMFCRWLSLFTLVATCLFSLLGFGSWRWLTYQRCVRWPPHRSRRTHGYTPPTFGWLFSPSASMPRNLALRTSPWQISTTCEPCLWRSSALSLVLFLYACHSIYCLLLVHSLSATVGSKISPLSWWSEVFWGSQNITSLHPQNTLVETSAIRLSMPKVTDLNSHNLRHASKSSS